MKYKGKKELMELIRSKDLKKDLIYNNIYNYLLYFFKSYSRYKYFIFLYL